MVGRRDGKGEGRRKWMKKVLPWWPYSDGKINFDFVEYRRRFVVTYTNWTKSIAGRCLLYKGGLIGAVFDWYYKRINNFWRKIGCNEKFCVENNNCFYYNLLELKWKDEKDEDRKCRLIEVINRSNKLDKYLCNKTK